MRLLFIVLSVLFMLYLEVAPKPDEPPRKLPQIQNCLSPGPGGASGCWLLSLDPASAMNVLSLSWHWMAGAPLSREVVRSYLSQHVNMADDHMTTVEGGVGGETKDKDA